MIRCLRGRRSPPDRRRWGRSSGDGGARSSSAIVKVQQTYAGCDVGCSSRTQRRDRVDEAELELRLQVCSPFGVLEGDGEGTVGDSHSPRLGRRQCPRVVDERHPDEISEALDEPDLSETAAHLVGDGLKEAAFKGLRLIELQLRLEFLSYLKAK